MYSSFISMCSSSLVITSHSIHWFGMCKVATSQDTATLEGPGEYISWIGATDSMLAVSKGSHS